MSALFTEQDCYDAFLCMSGQHNVCSIQTKVCSLLHLISSSKLLTLPFLGGLSLHLNHLIASRMANYDWPFGTLPFGLF